MKNKNNLHVLATTPYQYYVVQVKGTVWDSILTLKLHFLKLFKFLLHFKLIKKISMG